MSTAGKCPKCGAARDANWPHALCPACLAAAGLATATDVAGSPTAALPTFAPPPGSPPSLEEVRRLFPALEVLELIGRGGMGVVYKARQPQLDRLVALKLLPAGLAQQPGFTERFGREARSLARLHHPHIVSVFDFGQTRSGDIPVAAEAKDGDRNVAAPSLFYLIMEYVDGANLRQLIAAKQITPETALSIVPKVCEALQFAHDEGILHRDIKPENILIDKKGRVKIADFGLAKLTGEEAQDHSLTNTGMRMGTPRYMAPEQFENTKTVDHRADIYSLGVVFYEMLTGEIPMGRFAAPSTKVQVDVRIDEVVLRSLEREPAQRYQHVSEVKTGVENVTLHGGHGVMASPPSLPERAGTGAKILLDDVDRLARRRQQQALSVGALLLLVGTWEMAVLHMPPIAIVAWVGGIVLFVVAFLTKQQCALEYLGHSIQVQTTLLSGQLLIDGKTVASGAIGPEIEFSGRIADGTGAGDRIIARNNRGFLCYRCRLFVESANTAQRPMIGNSAQPNVQSLETPARGYRVTKGWARFAGGTLLLLVLTLLFRLSGIGGTAESLHTAYFHPDSRAYEMLRVSTEDYALNGRPLPASEFSRHVWLNLIPKNGHQQSTLFVELPSRRVTYTPAGEAAMRTVPFTQDAILDWMQQQCGLDAGAGPVRAEAAAMYALLGRLDEVRPATVKHFDEIAVASLSCFRPQGSSETPDRRWYHGTALKPGEQLVFAALIACLIAAWLLLGRRATRTLPTTGSTAGANVPSLGKPLDHRVSEVVTKGIPGWFNARAKWVQALFQTVLMIAWLIGLFAFLSFNFRASSGPGLSEKVIAIGVPAPWLEIVDGTTSFRWMIHPLAPSVVLALLGAAAAGLYEKIRRSRPDFDAEKDRRLMRRRWIALGVLLALVIGLAALFMVRRPGAAGRQAVVTEDAASGAGAASGVHRTFRYNVSAPADHRVAFWVEYWRDGKLEKKSGLTGGFQNQFPRGASFEGGYEFSLADGAKTSPDAAGKVRWDLFEFSRLRNHTSKPSSGPAVTIHKDDSRGGFGNWIADPFAGLDVVSSWGKVGKWKAASGEPVTVLVLRGYATGEDLAAGLRDEEAKQGKACILLKVRIDAVPAAEQVEHNQTKTLSAEDVEKLSELPPPSETPGVERP